MKTIALVILALVLALPSEGQLMFRNDFTLGKHVKSRKKGLSFIGINLGRRASPDMTSGGRYTTLVIDVQALRNPGQTYTYRQLAERVYAAGPWIYSPYVQPVPQFLLYEPPVIAPAEMPMIKVRRSQFFRGL